MCAITIITESKQNNKKIQMADVLMLQYVDYASSRFSHVEIIVSQRVLVLNVVIKPFIRQ